MKLDILHIEDFSIFRDFDCNDERLNRFIVEDAKIYSLERIATTYAFTEENSSRIMGYASIANNSVFLPNNAKRYINNICRLKFLPSVKIARFAIAKRVQRKGYGKNFMLSLIDYIAKNNIFGCRFIDIDAYPSAVPFYEYMGFTAVGQQNDRDTVFMFMDILRYIKSLE